MSYRSIFLDPDWLHVRHLGWSDAWPDRDLRIMSRRNGPIMRHLAVSALEPGREGVLLTAIEGLRGPACEVTVHDLTGSPAIARLLGEARYRALSAERMLNAHTLVLDLAHEEDSLLSGMNTDTRRKLRQAEKAGVVFDGHCERNPAHRTRFLAAYNAMACERALATLPASELDRLAGSGHSRLAGAFSADGASACYVLTYEAGCTALFHHGASDGPVDHLLGRTVHWQLAQMLKAEHFAWYDFGGLPTPDPENGITRFKLGFGGTVIDLGLEYRRSGALMPLARRAARMVGR